MVPRIAFRRRRNVSGVSSQGVTACFRSVFVTYCYKLRSSERDGHYCAPYCWEIAVRRAYSPDLAPSDGHLLVPLNGTRCIRRRSEEVCHILATEILQHFDVSQRNKFWCRGVTSVSPRVRVLLYHQNTPAPAQHSKKPVLNIKVFWTDLLKPLCIMRLADQLCAAR